MKLIQFSVSGRQSLGVLEEDKITDLCARDPSIPNSLVQFLGHGKVENAVNRALSASGPILSLSQVTLLAPVTSSDKVICVGMNYRNHCEEQKAPIPTEPIIFNKFPSCIVGPYADIPYPDVTQELDWEVELAVVIGKKGKNISEASADEYIFGYTVAHDVSARDWQFRRNGGQWLVGKAMDGFCPMGPALVTRDDLDVSDLGIRCLVNGVTKQNSSTNQLVFSCQQIVAWISKFWTLLPGDVILTGTPPGVGVFMKPPQFLKRGDVVDCEIDGIGRITNKIV